MDRDRRRRIEELFQDALDKPGAEREEYLHREEQDASIRDEVLSLIRHHEPGMDVFAPAPSSPLPDPERVGPFEIQSRLGEGGMGVVYLARQTEPVSRTVALKLMQTGIGSEELFRRFAVEQEALARLEHPNVARLYEAGHSEDGRPYFAMEYVDGQPITRYCDEHRLTAKQRIELLAQACQGVQEAHQNGVIHRDLKPSNILVSEKDGIATPKIIDFGVAKALKLHEGQARQFTRFGQLVGTPEYMSPEQAEGLPVDTRSDVYSLGVVLYELLAGVLPLDATSIREEGFEAMMRYIRETEPSRPSTRVSTLGIAGSEAADRRRTNPQDLARLLRGELDWIALRALEKERSRRYANVTEFAADLQAYLHNEPVRARPLTLGYQLRKFARRNRMAVSLASLAAVAVVLFAIGMTVQAGRIAKERDRANQKSEVAEEVKTFLVDLFESSSPTVAQGSSLTVETILERGMDRIGEVEDLQVRAELMRVLAQVLDELGNFEQALELSEDAYETTVRLDGPTSYRALSGLNNLGLRHMRLSHNAVAESLFVECLEGWRATDQMDDPAAISSLQNLAQIQIALGHYESAEAQLREAIQRRIEVGGEDDPAVFRSRSALANVLGRQQRYDEAVELEQSVLADRRRVLGDDHPDTIESLATLAQAHLDRKETDEAEALLEEATERALAVLGEDHPDYQEIRAQLAYLHYQRGDYAKAEPFFRGVVDARLARLGPDNPNTLAARNNLGALYAQWGRYDQAEPIYREVLASRQRVLGQEHPQTLATHYALAMLNYRQHDLDESLEQLRLAVDGGFRLASIVDLQEGQDFYDLVGDPEFARLQEVVRASSEER